MIFFNKSKATWKKAYKLRDCYRVPILQQWKNCLKQSELRLKNILEDELELHRLYAYQLAEKNNFQGSSKFYWEQSQITINQQIELVQELIKDYKTLINDRRNLIKHLLRSGAL